MEDKRERFGTRVRGVESLGQEDFLAKPTGHPYRDFYDFIEGKRIDDRIPLHLWRVHDSLYDLSDFDHPGGKRWLELTRGTDITELFESHHIDMDRTKRVLAVYRVQEHEQYPLAPRLSPFTFEEDGFYVTLRRKIWDEFGGEVRKSGKSQVLTLGAPTQTERLADSLVVASAAATIAAGSAKRAGAAIAGAVFAGLLNGSMIGVGHNFLHQKDNFRRHYQDLSGMCSSEFRMHHAISHHPYTNTCNDVELNGGLQQGLDFFPVTKRSTLRPGPARKAAARAGLMMRTAVGIPILQLRRWAMILTGKFKGDTYDRLAQLLPAAQLATLATLQGSAARGAALFFLMQASSSTLFLWANYLTGPHFNDKCWHHGDQLDSRDWGIMQLQTNTERSQLDQTDDNLNVLTFGLHHLHHLFPTIDASQLSRIAPIFEEHCKEHNVRFELQSNEELAEGLFRCLDGYEPNDQTLNGLNSKL